jgi:hypothetical protein
MQKRKRGSRVEWNPEPIVHRDVLPAIVTPEVFAAAQEALIARQGRTRPHRASERLLAGRVRCAVCGRRMHSDATGFRCRGDEVEGERCSQARAKREPLTTAVIEGLAAKWRGQVARTRLRKALEKLVGKRSAADLRLDADRERVESLTREIETGTARLTTIPDSLVAPLTKRLDELARERDDIRQRIANAERVRPATSLVDTVGRVMGLVDELLASLADGEPHKVNRLLEAMGVVVYAEPGAGRAGKADTVRVDVDPFGNQTDNAPGDMVRNVAACGPCHRKPLLSFTVRLEGAA